MDEREEFVALFETQKLKKGDVAFIMQGDGLYRAERAAQLMRDAYAPVAVIVGNADDRSYGSFPSREVRDEMVRLGVPTDAVYVEETGAHTRAEAERGAELAKERGWKTVLLVTSPHHQYRAFLTFLQAMSDAHVDVELVNAVAALSWTERIPWGRRIDLLEQEFVKIAEYQKKGDVASYKDGIAYLKAHPVC